MATRYGSGSFTSMGIEALILDLARKELAPPGTPMFQLDISPFGAAIRAISATSALKLLVESWNLVTARTLLRTQ